MSDMAKNILVWLVIGLVLMTVFQSLAPRGASPTEMDYSTFLEMVRDDQISKVSISDDRTTIAGEKKDGSGFRTVAPYDPDLVAILDKHDVVIQQLPPTQ